MAIVVARFYFLYVLNISKYAKIVLAELERKVLAFQEGEEGVE
jgi:hypothetical protein